MGFGKLVVMGLIGIGCVAELIMTGAYATGYESKRKGAGAAIASFISAVVSGLAFAILYLDW